MYVPGNSGRKVNKITVYRTFKWGSFGRCCIKICTFWYHLESETYCKRLLLSRTPFMVSPNNKRHTRLRNWTLFLGGGLLFFRMVRALEALRKHVVYTMYSLWYIIYRELNITPCYSLTNYPTERKEYYTTKFDSQVMNIDRR